MGEIKKSWINTKKYIHIMLSHYVWLILILVLSVGVFWTYGETKGKQRFSAQYIIAAEQEKSSGWENLLAQFGMEVGGANPGGVFVGESLVRLFSIRGLIEKALLLPYDKDQPNGEKFADKFYGDLPSSVREKLRNVKFYADRKKNNPATDSAIFYLSKYINKKVLSATKPDKKQTFIHVDCKHQNDTLALRFAEAMISTVKDKYIQSITRNVRTNLRVLRSEADSIKRVMDANIERNAQNMDYNINPLQQKAKIEQNKSLIDMQISISLYGEVIKNLKLAELALKKQTPLMEVVEEPHFPLERTGYPIYIYWIMGIAVGLIVHFLWLYVDGRFDSLP